MTDPYTGPKSHVKATCKSAAASISGRLERFRTPHRAVARKSSSDQNWHTARAARVIYQSPLCTATIVTGCSHRRGHALSSTAATRGPLALLKVVDEKIGLGSTMGHRIIVIVNLIELIIGQQWTLDHHVGVVLDVLDNHKPGAVIVMSQLSDWENFVLDRRATVLINRNSDDAFSDVVAVRDALAFIEAVAV